MRVDRERTVELCERAHVTMKRVAALHRIARAHQRKADTARREATRRRLRVTAATGNEPEQEPGRRDGQDLRFLRG
jgi:hypothetical protein